MKIIFTLCFLYLSFAQAYIPPTRMILQRVVDNSGSGTYVLEQEIQFMNGLEPIHLKETWVIENERTMKLTVSGTKEYKDTVKLQFMYVGGQKWQLKNKSRENSKVPDEFFERYFHFRSLENMGQWLQGQGLIPSQALNIKHLNAKKVEDFKYDPENFVRLSRTDGVVTYAFGTPTPPQQKDPNPGLWIEQDQFLIRKFRWSTQAEISAENYGNFPRNLSFPRTRYVRWDNHSVSIRLIQLSARPNVSGNFFQPSNLDINNTLEGLSTTQIKGLVEEFYSRFR